MQSFYKGLDLAHNPFHKVAEVCSLGLVNYEWS